MDLSRPSLLDLLLRIRTRFRRWMYLHRCVDAMNACSIHSLPLASSCAAAPAAHALLEGTPTAFEALSARIKAPRRGCTLDAAAFCQPHPTNVSSPPLAVPPLQTHPTGVSGPTRHPVSMCTTALYCSTQFALRTTSFVRLCPPGLTAKADWVGVACAMCSVEHGLELVTVRVRLCGAGR